MAAVADVVLRIGSQMGPGGLASLESGLRMVTQLAGAALSLGRAFDEANDVMANTQVEIGKAVAATKGLVSGLDAARAANKFYEANLKITSEQLAIVAKRAALFADTTGISEKDALDRLTDALIRGNERGLRPFGIAVDSTLPPAERLSAAIASIGESTAKAEVQLTSITDKVTSTKNSLFAIGQVAVGAAEAFGTGLVSGLAGGEEAFANFTANLLDDMDRIQISFSELGKAIMNGSTWDEIGEAISKRTWEQTRANIAKIKADSDESIAAAWDSEYEKQIERLEKIKQDALAKWAREDEMKKGSRRGGGGRRRKAAATDDVAGPARPAFTDEDLISGYGRMSGADGAAADMMSEWAAETKAAADAADELNAEMARGYELQVQIAQASGDETEIKRAMIEQLKNERDIKEQIYQDAIKQGEGVDSPRMRNLRLEIELANAKLEQLEHEASFIETLSDRWVAAHRDMDVATLVSTGLIDMERGAVEASMRAFILQEKSAKQAVLEVVSQVAMGIAVQAALYALYEGAEAVRAFASYRYDEGAQHVTAAALYTAAAAAAGALAYGTNKAAGGSSRSNRDVAPTTAPGGVYSPNGTRDERDTVVNVRLDLDGATVYESQIRERQRRSDAGQEL